MRQPLKDPSTSVGIGILISSSCINIRVAKVVEFQEKLHYELVNSAPFLFWISITSRSKMFAKVDNLQF
jgi:hypothetical protein